MRTRAGIGDGQFFLLQVLLSAVVAVGELPTGYLTDRIGYRNSLLLSQLLLLLARGLLLAAYLLRSLPLFVAEAVVEGVSACLSSGTGSAYLYARCGEADYLSKTAHAANFGTAGFLLSTAGYAAIYRAFDLTGLLIATILSGAAGLLCAILLPREPRGAVTRARTEKVGLKQLRLLLHDRRARQFTTLLSIFSMAWLLVNFFYAELLAQCGIPLTWLSAVIILYSLVQMLAEPLIRLCRGRAKAKLTGLFCLLCGLALAGLGLLHGAWVLLPMMVLLPLLLDLAAFSVEEQQNLLIDALELGHGRAAALSVMNIGVSLMEVFSLFASSLLAAAGIGWCFGLCGALLMLCAVCRGVSSVYAAGNFPLKTERPHAAGQAFRPRNGASSRPASAP